MTRPACGRCALRGRSPLAVTRRRRRQVSNPRRRCCRLPLRRLMVARRRPCWPGPPRSSVRSSVRRRPPTVGKRSESSKPFIIFTLPARAVHIVAAFSLPLINTGVFYVKKSVDIFYFMVIFFVGPIFQYSELLVLTPDSGSSKTNSLYRVGRSIEEKMKLSPCRRLCWAVRGEITII
jgi:hypothetical protein